MEENNWKLEDFSGEETKDKRSISSSINVVHSKIVLLLQSRVNNLNIRKRKTAFTHFKVKPKKNSWFSVNRQWKSSPFSYCVQGLLGVHRGKIDHQMDHWVGTADGQSEGLQVIRVGAPWPVYLEPSVIQRLSHGMNLGMSFLQ